MCPLWSFGTLELIALGCIHGGRIHQFGDAQGGGCPEMAVSVAGGGCRADAAPEFGGEGWRVSPLFGGEVCEF